MELKLAISAALIGWFILSQLKFDAGLVANRWQKYPAHRTETTFGGCFMTTTYIFIGIVIYTAIKYQWWIHK
jgi:hypothetical protein